MRTSRREFLGAGLAGLAVGEWPRRRAPTPNSPQAGTTVLLFQGDSITDCSRNRQITTPNDPRALGTGYPLLLTAALRERHPARDLQVFNRGVSGDKVIDLRARWQSDTLALHPAIISILVGVNDLWHTLSGRYDGTVEKYQAGYDALLASTRNALPGVTLIVLEPFALRTGAVTDAWFPEFDRYRAAADRVARTNDAVFVPLHDMFQELARQNGPAYWAADGVHPTLAGHEAIARKWLEIVAI